MKLAGKCVSMVMVLLSSVSCDVSDIPDSSKTLVIGSGAEISTLDYSTTLLGSNGSAINLAYEQLFSFELQNNVPTGRLVPELAHTLQRSEDGLKYTVRLNREHFFDDGTEVTADAVKFSFDRTRFMPGGQSDALRWLTDVEVLDTYTVAFHLSEPVPFFPNLLALVQGSVVNPAIMRHEVDGDWAGLWLNDHTAGSGPYRLSRMVIGDRAVFELNPHGRPPAWFNRIELRTILDAVDRKIQLANGDVDIVDGIVADDLMWLQSKTGVRPLTGQSPEAMFLHMNNDHPLLSDIRVRRAIAMSIDRAAMINGVYAGLVEQLDGILPAFIPGHDPTLPVTAHDPARARSLLEEAGVAEGTTLVFTDWFSGRGSTAAVLLIQQNLREIGLDVTIKKTLPSARDEIFAGNFDLTLQIISFDFPDAWIAFNFLFNAAFTGSIGNISRYRNAEANELILAANREVDDNTRIALYLEAQRIIMDDLPLLPISTYPRMLALRDDLRGLEYNFAQPRIYNAEHMWREGEINGQAKIELENQETN